MVCTQSGLSFGCEDGMNNNAPDSPSGDPGDVQKNSQNPSTNAEEQILENSAASCRTQRARSTEKVPEKTRPKKNKHAVLESLVALRKEELESYKDLKSKQIESYKEVKLA